MNDNQNVNALESSSKVIHFCKIFYPIRGGIEAVVDSCCRAYRGYNEIVTCGEYRKFGEIYSYAKVRAYKPLLTAFSMPLSLEIVWRLKRALATNDATVVLHYPFPLLDFALLIFGRNRKSKVILYWHSEIVGQRFLKHLVAPITKSCFKYIDCVIVATPEIKKHSNLLRYYRGRFEVIPYTVPFTETCESAKQRTIVPEGDYFLSIGRLVGYKGFEYLIEAIADTKFRLVIVGNGPLYSALKNKIFVLGIEDRVTILTQIDDDEKDTLIKGCKALVLPSILESEAFALVQLEAMRYAKPIINTSLKSGVPWVARNNIEALTVRPKSARSLRLALNELAASEYLCEQLGESGYKRYKEVFSYQAFKRAWLDELNFV